MLKNLTQKNLYSYANLVLALLAFFVISPAWAQEVNPKTFPLALTGYDVTTYFTETAPIKGSKTYQATYQNRRYLFVNKENQIAFSKSPEKYIPAFGEHCAFSASQQKVAQANPEIFAITQERLVLFNNNQVLANWRENEDANYAQAQQFWEQEHKYDASKRLREENRVRLFNF